MTLALILETILRTVAVAAVAGFGLALFQVRSSTVKLAAWRLVLYASLLMPLATLVPKRRAIVVPPPASVARVIERATTRFAIPSKPRPTQTNWPAVTLRGYSLIAGLLLLRSLLGLLRLRMLAANAIPLAELGPAVFESADLHIPVTYGVLRPRVLLPADWRNWPQDTLAAVLAHERAHIAERDFLTQCLSKVNRALYWANPVAWWIDGQLAQLAEHASDDAALHRVQERPAYAAVLLGFAARRSNLASMAGVAMARTGGVSGRIERILDDTNNLSQPLSPATRAALGALAFAAVLIVGACRMTTIASAQSKPPAPKTDVWWSNDGPVQEWVLVTPKGSSMTGDNRTMARAKDLKARISGDFFWFRRDGKEYLVNDPQTLTEIKAWFEPLEELGRQQGELGEQQGVLGEQMGKLGEEMARLGEQMANVKVEMPDMKKLRSQIEQLSKLTSEKAGRDREVSIDELQSLLGELQSHLGEAQSRAGEKQAKIGELQARLGEKQGELGEKQGKLGELQGKLGDQQGKIAAEAEQKLRSLMDQVMRDGRAKPVQ